MLHKGCRHFLPKPDHFEFDIFGCRHSLSFPIVKLTDLADLAQQLETDANPFAIVTSAHLRTRETKHDPPARYQAKRTLVHQDV